MTIRRSKLEITVDILDAIKNDNVKGNKAKKPI